MVDISFGHRYNVLIYEECDEEKEYCSYTFHRELPVGERRVRILYGIHSGAVYRTPGSVGYTGMRPLSCRSIDQILAKADDVSHL